MVESRENMTVRRRAKRRDDDEPLEEVGDTGQVIARFGFLVDLSTEL